MSKKFFFVALLVLAFMSSCAFATEKKAPSVFKTENLTSYVFHFGGGKGESVVTRAMMDEFIAKVIVPKFPTGTTVFDGAGQWQNPETGEIQRESSYVMSLECYPTTDNVLKVKGIAAEYVNRFKSAGVSCFIKIFPGVTTELHYY
ncbi:DUF3574 domain-containing protein [Synergistaceae bacterium OttesenSCG-928-I11]|nr:DUF3574 domain-containing protein [Synergistaceae bacterium OttesenSCG-928-I11]